MIFSLPDVCESKRSVVRGFIGQFQAGENSRSTEEGVGQKSGPWVRIVTRAIIFGYGLTTRGVRHREGDPAVERYLTKRLRQRSRTN